MYFHAQREGWVSGSARGHSSIQQQQLLGRQTRSLLVSIAVCWAFLVLGCLGAAASDRKGSEQLWFLHFPPYVTKVTLNEVYIWVWASPEYFMKHMKSLGAGPQVALKASRIPTPAWSERNTLSWPHHLPHVQGIFLPPTPWGFQIKSGQVMSFLIVQKACQSV